MNRFTSSENLISNLREGRLVALTAPFVIDQNVLIGYTVSPEEGYMASGICAVKNSLTQFLQIR